MPVPSTWIEYRRASDRERLGWVREEGDRWVAVDLLGRDATAAVDLDRAEAALEELGLTYLGDKWELVGPDGTAKPVRLVEVTPDRIVVKGEDFGAIDAPVTMTELPWPAPDELRPRG